MYTKEEIVAEIRRVAAYLKVDTLTPTQFQECSTIPMNTVEFFMGSWKSALLEARLPGSFMKEPTSKDLLSELWRIHELTGEIPTFALVDQYGKYPAEKYQQHWRNLEVPYKLAQRYFGEKKEEVQKDGYLTDAGRTRMFSSESHSSSGKAKGEENRDPNEDSQDLDAQLAATVVSAPVPEFASPTEEEKSDGSGEKVDQDEKENEGGEDADRSLASWPEGDDEASLPEYHIDIHDSKEPVVIPDLTPEIAPEKRLRGERLHFRGLQFPPSDRNGVIFLFGMVAVELGFFLETAGENAGFTGFRTHRLDQTEWSPVRLRFIFQSDELIGKEAELNDFTHVVCWEHNWSQCPLPVLGLSTLIRELPNFKRPS